MTDDAARCTTVIETRVRFFETDLMGIVHHAAYLTYFEAGRVEYLRRRGVTYADWASRGVHLPVVELRAHYERPARFDDMLEIVTKLTDLRSVSLKFEYVITRGGERLASGATRLGCVDHEGKIFRIPEEMRSVLERGELA